MATLALPTLAETTTPTETDIPKAVENSAGTNETAPTKPANSTENTSTDKSAKTGVAPIDYNTEESPKIIVDPAKAALDKQQVEQAKIEAEKIRQERQEAENQRIIFKITSEMSSNVLGKPEESDKYKDAVNKEKILDDLIKLRAYQAQ